MKDVKRLKQIVKKLESLEGIYYHMDSDEYSRMVNYVYSRFGIRLPSDNPQLNKAQP